MSKLPLNDVGSTIEIHVGYADSQLIRLSENLNVTDIQRCYSPRKI